MEKYKICALVVSLGLALCACSPQGQGKSAALAAINKGLASTPGCFMVPVEMEHLPSVYGPGPTMALNALLAQGLVKAGTVVLEQYVGPPKTKDGFLFSEKGQRLVVPSTHTGPDKPMPCVRNGKYEVTQIDAIDVANDSEGRVIASVRAHVRFVAEDWFNKTRDDPAWAGYWVGIKKSEESPWLYRLIKSGDEFYYTGSGLSLE
jgi:hypothetical protein